MEWFQEGHVAIVTGGTRGLGKELARELLAKGLLVIIDGRDAVELERARKELADVGTIVAIAGDVSDPESRARPDCGRPARRPARLTSK
jgi:3-oxoacyl-[acyl-carrier protein] reductase